MKKSDLTYVTGAMLAALTSFFYCCTWWFQINLPRYYPLARTWKWTREPGIPSQAWYGMQGFAFLAAGLATAAVYLLLQKAYRGEKKLSPALAKGIGLAALLVILVCLGYMLYYEYSHWQVFSRLLGHES